MSIDPVIARRPVRLELGARLDLRRGVGDLVTASASLTDLAGGCWSPCANTVWPVNSDSARSSPIVARSGSSPDQRQRDDEEAAQEDRHDRWRSPRG